MVTGAWLSVALLGVSYCCPPLLPHLLSLLLQLCQCINVINPAGAMHMHTGSRSAHPVGLSYTTTCAQHCWAGSGAQMPSLSCQFVIRPHEAAAAHHCTPVAAASQVRQPTMAPLARAAVLRLPATEDSSSRHNNQRWGALLLLLSQQLGRVCL